jgi:hypothetical protein
MVSLLLDCQPGNIQQNHPATTYRAYLKINTKGGFYWLYCNLSQDGSGSVLRLDANNCNATNPNGAKAYDLANFSELLTMLGRTNSASPGGPANRSQPIRAERPIAGAKSVRSPLQLALDIIGNTAFFGLIAWLYIRARRKSPRFEKPDVIYQEWSASGASQRNILTKVLGARNCLRLVVTWDFLWVTSWFPFSIFCPLYDLEHVIPLHSIVSVRNAGFYGSRSLLVTFSDEKGHSHALMLRPKNPAIFAKSLGVQIETESKSKQSATVKGSIPEN